MCVLAVCVRVRVCAHVTCVHISLIVFACASVCMRACVHEGARARACALVHARERASVHALVRVRACVGTHAARVVRAHPKGSGGGL